ncbi:MAG: DNA-binding domain-containing protein [Terracidiphilus sp.]|nr:DNA-binding domain-containing protein [Terracidiphilus sp.]
MRLEALQREMAAAVMMPLTRDENMRASAPDGRSMSEVAASFVAPNSRLTSFERLEIYNRQYWFRVLDALREDFSAVAAVVGKRKWDALAIAYLTAHPSRSFTLRNIGSRLEEWLVANPQFAGRRAQLAAHVARLEWAHVESFDAADAAPLSSDEMSTIDGGSHLALQPHLRLLELHYPIDELVIALHRKHRDGEAENEAENVRLPSLRRRMQWLAVHRADHSVYYRRLEREEFRILQALGRGAMLSDALEQGFDGSRMAAKTRTAKLSAWFRHWAELGWLCARNESKSAEDAAR